MPAWWGKKSSKHKDPQNDSPKSSSTNSHNSSSSSSSSSKAKAFEKKKKNSSSSNKKPKSFDELVFSRNSPRNSKEYAAVRATLSSGFSGFDSPSSSSDRLYPLPRPSVSSVPGNNCNNSNNHFNGNNSNDQGGVVGLGFASVSGSSVSSSGSSDDHPHIDHAHQLGALRGLGDGRLSPLPRSPGPASRGPTTTTSPLHPRFSGLNLDSPTGKLEDGRGECHPLPLPPGSPTSPTALPAPRTSGVADCLFNNPSKWKKGRLLGRGTFGHVYLGFNSEKGKMCAIKEVKVVTDDQTSKECLKQLNQEINLLSQLYHPNIVQYYGSELSEETLSVYLEYVSGGSIHKLLQEYGPFSEPVIQNYTRQILAGVSYLHGRNTVHRDIKGANILVDPNGEIKLADFGMAKHITACTSMLSFKGSPYWMAPEVVMNTNGYSLAVDIWSLGCTILEMATSKPPWSQFEGVAAIFKIGNSKDMPEIPDHLSADAKSFIRLCLQREPSARPAAAQLLEHPFVRDQTTARGSNINLTREAFPNAFDGSRTPPVLELHSGRMNNVSSDGNATNAAVAVSRASINPRGNSRTITSLPVSPCSSPLRQHGPQHRSWFLSPPHPSYPLVSQNGHNINDHPVFPVMPNTRSTLDPWLQTPELHTQIPDRSQRTRTIL